MQIIKMIKFEVNRVLKSKRFWIVLGIGLTISVMQAVHYALADIENYFNLESDYPIVCWLSYLGRDMQLFYRSLYYIIFPILASLGFSTSYYEDKQSGYYKNIMIQTTRINYAAAKYIVSFVAGGIVVVVPLIISLYFHAGFISVSPPNELSLQAVPLDGDMLCNLFYEHPMVYVIIFFMINFFVGGCIAGITLIFSLIAKKRYSVCVFSFVFCMLESNILYQFNSSGWAFSYVADTSYVPLNGVVVFLKVSFTMILTFVTYIYIINRKDVL